MQAANESTQLRSWSRLTRLVVTAVSLTAVFLFIYAARAVIGPLIVAGLIAYALNPAVGWFMRVTKLPRKTAVIPIYLLFLIILTTLPIILIPILIEQGSGLAAELAAFDLRDVALLSALERAVGLDLEAIANPLAQIQSGLSQIFRPEMAVTLGQTVLTNLAWIAVTLVAAFYLLRDWSGLRDWLISIAPEEAQPEIRRIYEEIKVVWRSYLRGQLLLMLLVGTVSAIGGAAVGLPGALLLGLVAGLLDVIPSVGPFVAMIIAIGIAGIEGSSYLPVSNVVFMLIVAAVYMTIQTVENVWWRPAVMEHSLKIHPAVIFVAVMGALALISPVAALIAVPTIGSISIIGRAVMTRLRGEQDS
jgi:predicted PurR-regulated permease PerM